MSNRPPENPDGHPPGEPEYIELIEAESAHAHPPAHVHSPAHVLSHAQQPPQDYYPPPQHPVSQQPAPQRRRYEDVALGALAVFGIRHIHERVTGCIVSAIVVPIFICVFGGIVYFSMKDSTDRRAKRDAERAAEKLKDEISTTQRNLQSASDRVQREARRLRRLPHDDEGSRLMIGMRDGWREDLQYEIVDTQSYRIRSGGPDSVRGNDDDLVIEKAAPNLIGGTSISTGESTTKGDPIDEKAAVAAFNLDDLSEKTKPVMTRLVNSSSYQDSSESLQELAAMEPIDADRDQVVSVAINYARELRLAGFAAQVVRNWATIEQTQLIVDILLEDSIRGSDPTNALMQTLIDTKAEEAMLRLINHPRTDIADVAMETVKAWGVDDATLARQLVDDLKSLTAGSRNWITALERLQTLPIEEDGLQKEINDTLIPLTAENPARMEGIYDILKKTITKDELEQLLVFRSRQNEKQLVGVLAEIQDPLAYQTIVQIALENNEDRALTVLRADIGSRAESFVWPYLEDSSSFTKKQAVNLLATIGTSKSLSRLENIAANDRFVASDAKIAIRFIRKRSETKVDE